MRVRWIAIIAAAVLAQQVFFQASHGDETPPVGLGAQMAAEPDPRGLARLVAATQEWWEQLIADEVADDALVYCVRGDDSEFLRSSECARRGGRPEEPSWAQN